MFFSSRLSNSNFRLIFLFAIIFVGVSPLFGTLIKSLVFLILGFYLLAFKFILHKIDVLILFLLSISILFIASYNDLYYYNYKLFNEMNFYFYFNIIVGFMISNFFSKHEIIKKIELFVLTMVCLGLPFHFLSLLFPGILNYFITYDNGHALHKTLGFINFHISDQGLYEGRFMSFAWEPGVMQMLLNIALYSRLSRFHRHDFYSILLIICIFLTYSTAGYFILFVVLATKGYLFRPYIIVFILFLSIYFWGFFVEIYEYQAAYKLVNSNSFAGRYDRLFHILSNWDKYDLLFGRGSNFYDLNLREQDLGGFDSITNLIQRYGLLSVISIFIAFIFNNNTRLVLVFIIFATFLSQPIWMTPIVASFYFKGIGYN